MEYQAPKAEIILLPCEDIMMTTAENAENNQLALDIFSELKIV